MGEKIIVSNRRARRDYYVTDTFEAGIVLVDYRRSFKPARDDAFSGNQWQSSDIFNYTSKDNVGVGIQNHLHRLS